MIRNVLRLAAVALIIAIAVSAPAVARRATHRAATVGTSSADGDVVVRVVDGDTIVTLDHPEKVRIIGVNTPEKGDCGAGEATERLRRLLPVNTPVTLIPDRDDHDKYGRYLAYVETGRVDVGRVLLADGFAKILSIKPNTARAVDYASVSATAETSRTGLWATCPTELSR